MKLKKLFTILLLINTTFLSFVVFIISEYNKATKELENAYIMQNKSILLADELRQSSDDLTRVARTYVITGNPMFKEQFQMILDIRNGIKPRPKNYNRIYWDFLTLKGSSPILDGDIIPLKDLMKKAGFLESELSLLYEAKKESDKLTYLETKAMNAIKGIFQDKNGNYIIKSKPDFKMAIDIMHSDEYHKAKIAIMKPIDKFFEAFEKRTNNKIRDAHLHVKDLENYVGFTILFLIILVLFSMFVILSRVIYPLESLKNAMLSLAKNRMNTKIPKHIYNDEVGEMIGTMTIFKQNAIKLISSEQKNKSLLDLAGEGIFGLDSSGKFTFLNPMACRLLGVNNQKELIGQYFYNFVSSTEFNKSAHLYKKLMLTLEENLYLKSQIDRTFPIDYVSTPIYGDNHIISGSVVVFSDITERKKNEDKLKQAIKDANAANHSKSLFLANMSHELRTPLNAILGFTKLLRKSPNLNSQEKENLSTIKNSGRHLLTIINEILELSKIEAGKIDVKLVDFNFIDMIKDIEMMFESRYREKNILFTVNMKQEIPKYIKTDEQRLKQIIINLLGNSFKFTNQGSVELNILTKDEKLYFEIIDTGVGIEESEIKNIFKPFEQVEKNRHITGSGLGLAITKELVERLGGEIGVESELNKGSKFSFYIKYEESHPEFVVEKFDENEVIEIKQNSNNTILVVDDIKENRTLLSQILEQNGFEVLEAVDGKDAIEKFKENRVDLIFMDILMPNIDGYEATQTIRILSREIPIITVSAHVFKEDEQKALDLGANEFISKPIDEMEVYRCLEKYLNVEVIYKHDKKEYYEKPSLEVLTTIKNFANKLDVNSIENLLEKENLKLEFKERVSLYLKNYDFMGLVEFCDS
jgi:PAS domain S-box-containing protein